MAETAKRIARRRRGGQPGNQNALTHGRYPAEGQAATKLRRRRSRELLGSSKETLQAAIGRPSRAARTASAEDGCAPAGTTRSAEPTNSATGTAPGEGAAVP
jgi:hypothetical protein